MTRPICFGFADSSSRVDLANEENLENGVITLHCSKVGQESKKGSGFRVPCPLHANGAHPWKLSVSGLSVSDLSVSGRRMGIRDGVARGASRPLGTRTSGASRFRT